MNKSVNLLLILMSGCFSLNAQTAYYSNLMDHWKNSAGLNGGAWSIPSDEQQVMDAMIAYGGNAKQIAVSDQSFLKALQLNVPTAGVNAWDAAVFINNTSAITVGDRLLVTMWIRSAENAAAYGSLYIEHTETYYKEAYYSFPISGNWTQMILPIEVIDNYPAGKLRFGFQVGTKVQKLEFGGFAVRNYGISYPLSKFPFDLHQNYAGSEQNAVWRADASARIEAIRKANLNIHVTDSKGKALAGAKVKVKMLQHEFKFGSAITANRIAGNNAYDSTYENKIMNFDGNGHGFNEVVFENDLKWDAWEQHWGASQREIEHATYALKNQKISIRGHNLIWPSWQYMPADMQANKSSLSYLKSRINDRLNTMLSLPAFRKNISEWDVINEITDNHDLANAFKGSPNYTTGREIYADIMKNVKLLDPNMTTYLNDYVTIDQGNVVGSPKYELCKQYINEVINSGANVDGIGFQAHIGAGLVSMYDVKNTLDDFYKTYNNRAKITEFDLNKLVNDSLGGKFAADFLTMCFSHPYVDGFLSWGFWDGAHWQDNSPYFRKDWTMKPAGKSVSDLLFNQWWTKDTILTTDQQGIASIRGFRGLYQISELCNTSKDTIQLFGDQKMTITSKVPISEFSYKSFERDIWLSNFSLNADSTYWDFGDNTNSSQFSPQHKYLKDGSYLVKLRSFNKCGYSDTSQLIAIKSTAAADISRFFIHKLYPNPSSGDFTLEIMGVPNGTLQVELMNSLSQSVYDSVIDFSAGYLQQHLDFGEAGSGIYFLKIKNGEGMLTLPLLIR